MRAFAWIFLLATSCGGSTASIPAASYWDVQRKGANFFNHLETHERLQAAHEAGIELIRLAPDKWDSEERDFLIGNADDFDSIPARDLATLQAVLDDANSLGIKVVLTMLSLPGLRWVQQNGDVEDIRLYTDSRYQDDAVRFWRELSGALREHPAIVGYNIINEPHPERSPAARDFDLHAFYSRMVGEIREVDPHTTIVLDGPAYASPYNTDDFLPVADENVIYAFHMYEPWAFIDHRQDGSVRYPGPIPSEEGDETVEWNRESIVRLFDKIASWQRDHQIPSRRVFLAEFGCPRTHVGAREWLTDVISVANEKTWHWAFYSYREDTWPAMDYELGTGPLPPGYWEADESERDHMITRSDNALWDVIGREFR